MTPEIIEGNRLIAEFLGWAYHTKEYNWKRSRIDYPTWSDGTMGWKELHFHTSWDWLMPAVEKIRNDHFVNIEMYGDFVATWITKDKDYPKEEQKIYSQHKDAITSIYKAVIQFIKWYNQNK